MRQEGERWVMELPSPGWVRAYWQQALFGGLVLVFPLATLGIFYARHPAEGMLDGLLTGFGLLLAVPVSLGGVFLHRSWVAARTSWRLTVSRHGLELVHQGPGSPRTTRLVPGLIRDVDVRELVEPHVRLRPSHRSPVLVVERRDGEVVTLGAGLPREELEWAAARVRQELAVLNDARHQERSAG